MKRRIVLRRIAEQEFSDAIAWYEKERAGLGREFQAAIAEYFQRIADDPKCFPKVRADVRRAVVRRFPFVIHFLIEKERAVILAVYHTSRHPVRLTYRH